MLLRHTRIVHPTSEPSILFSPYLFYLQQNESISLDSVYRRREVLRSSPGSRKVGGQGDRDPTIGVEMLSFAEW